MKEENITIFIIELGTILMVNFSGNWNKNNHISRLTKQYKNYLKIGIEI